MNIRYFGFSKSAFSDEIWLEYENSGESALEFKKIKDRFNLFAENFFLNLLKSATVIQKQNCRKMLKMGFGTSGKSGNLLIDLIIYIEL